MIGPERNTTPSPVRKSVAVTARGIFSSSKVLTGIIRLRKPVMRSLVAKPKRETVQRAKCLKRTTKAISSSSLAESPLQKPAPITAPTLVPATKSMGIFSSSKTLSTPMCVMPRANPPPRASPILGRVEGALGAGSGSWLRVSSWLNALTDRTSLNSLFKNPPLLCSRSTVYDAMNARHGCWEMERFLASQPLRREDEVQPCPVALLHYTANKTDFTPSYNRDDTRPPRLFRGQNQIP